MRLVTAILLSAFVVGSSCAAPAASGLEALVRGQGGAFSAPDALRTLLDLQAMAERARVGETRSSYTATLSVSVVVLSEQGQGRSRRCRDFSASLSSRDGRQSLGYRGCVADGGGLWSYVSR